ncbi:uncharacterized protein LOC103519848 [Diaphorina citri]|uniref:Uncharacterized protein LOC103519848 n=1 Tax=Diaphorina citri TaxID=121845 RepID=A0A3Q0JEU0_DIACI|nr:uncharacterized protein LOC103519848 [Diaphorina citri]
MNFSNVMERRYYNTSVLGLLTWSYGLTSLLHSKTIDPERLEQILDFILYEGSVLFESSPGIGSGLFESGSTQPLLMVVMNVFLCTTMTMYWASLPYAFRFLPKGKCSYCCPINEPDDITFLLFTRANSHTPDILRAGHEMDLKMSHMNRQMTTVFYIHGFTEQANGESGTTVKDAYLRRGDFNIILVDWSGLSAFPWYTNAKHFI